MSANQCARCEQTVYPVEGLRCLEKMWHKGCFKCQECSMTLNLKNYRGFDKKPYCNAHCPQAKATTVADTPESRRLAENTRIQSQAKYHEDFEKSKGKNFTTIADDPETVRIKNTSKIISNVSYHGELERKKQMEEKRAEEAINTNNNSSQHQNRMHHHHNNNPHHHSHQRQQEPIANQPNNHHHHHQQQQQQMKLHKQLLEQQQQSQLAHQQQALKYSLLKQQQQHQQVLYSHNDHHQAAGAQPIVRQVPHLLPTQVAGKHVHQQYPQTNGNLQQQQQQMISRQHQAAMQQQRHPHQVDMNRLSGGGAGHMPTMAGGPLGQPNPQQPQQMIKIPLQQSPKYAGQPIGELHQPSPTHLVGGGPNMIGQPKVVSYMVNPGAQPMMNHPAFNQRPPHMGPAMVNGALPKQQQQYIMPTHLIRHVQPQPPNSQQQQHQQHQMMQRNQHMHQQQQQQIHYQQQAPITARVYRAIYDYEANDIDEVTFFENDVLINCVDAGGNWLIGKVARTGQEGMFPANYVTEYSNHP